MCVLGWGGIVCVRMFVGGEGGSVLCVYERENVCVCVCVRGYLGLSACVHVCACTQSELACDFLLHSH